VDGEIDKKYLINDSKSQSRRILPFPALTTPISILENWLIKDYPDKHDFLSGFMERGWDWKYLVTRCTCPQPIANPDIILLCCQSGYVVSNLVPSI